MELDYYKWVVCLGLCLVKLVFKIDIVGYFLGGGLVFVIFIVSGQVGWIFNVVGLYLIIVEKYGGSLLGEVDNIQVYCVEGELLIKIQEVNLVEDYKMLKGYILMFIVKEEIFVIMFNVVGVVYDFFGGIGGLLDCYGIGQVIDCIEQ